MGSLKQAFAQSGVERRMFLKLGGLGVAGTAAFAGTATSSASADEVADQAAVQVPYSVYDTDILLIGGGYGAAFAMKAAVEAGQRLLVVDKGPWGFSGAAGMNFDIMNTWVPYASYDSVDDVVPASYIRDNDLYRTAVFENQESDSNADVTIANFGEILSARNDDGTPYYIYDYPTVRGFEHSMTRHWSDHFGSSPLVTIQDQVMICDLIVENGRCLGAVGLHVPTGDYRVYRAKATVSATGGCTQFYGWNSTSATTNNVADNSGDVEASILRHGGRIADNEFCTYDLMGMTPSSFAASEGGNVGADSVHSGDLVDVNGKPLSEYDEIVERGLLGSQEGVIQAMSLVNDMGNGTPNGGIYLRCTEESLPTMRWMYQRNAQMLKDTFGFDVTQEYVEVLPEMYEHGGQPLVDENAMCRDFEGLFVVRANSGSQGGNVNNTNRPMANLAMKRALAYAADYTAPESVTYESVDAEIARLEGLRTADADDALRPVAVRRAVQTACAQAARPVRSEEVLTEAAAELERIRLEDVPRMVCADKSRTYNMDWKDAIETLNILQMARLFVDASLNREESRASMIRPEFPETDDENWNCSLAYSLAEDGSLSFEKITY